MYISRQGEKTAKGDKSIKVFIPKKNRAKESQSKNNQLKNNSTLE